MGSMISISISRDSGLRNVPRVYAMVGRNFSGLSSAGFAKMGHRNIIGLASPLGPGLPSLASIIAVYQTDRLGVVVRHTINQQNKWVYAGFLRQQFLPEECFVVGKNRRTLPSIPGLWATHPKRGTESVQGSFVGPLKIILP